MERDEDFGYYNEEIVTQWKQFGDNFVHKDEILNEGMNFCRFVEFDSGDENDYWGFVFCDYQDAYITILREVCTLNNRVFAIVEYCIYHTPEDLLESKELLEFFNDCVDSFELLAKECGYDIKKKVEPYGVWSDYKTVTVKCETAVSSKESFEEVYKKFFYDRKLLGASMCGAPIKSGNKVLIRLNKHFRYGYKEEEDWW